MAIDFDALTSKLEHTTASGFDVATLTICAWSLADGQGENALGRVISVDENGNAFLIRHSSENNRLGFVYAWTTGSGLWTVSATDGAWRAIAWSYDRGSTANDPVARVDFASATVTEELTPSGTVTSPNTGYCIGNNSARTRTWDGALAHIQFFNVILTAAEMDAALRRPGSIRRGLVYWWPLFDSSYTVDLVSNSKPIATALATRNSPPCAPVWPGPMWGWRGAFTAAAAAGQPTMRRWGHVGHLPTTSPRGAGIR